MPQFVNADGDVESRTNDGELRWLRINGITRYGAVPEATPRAVQVGVDPDGVERNVAVSAEGVVVTEEMTAALQALAEEGNLLARAAVLGLTLMTEEDLLAEVAE